MNQCHEMTKRHQDEVNAFPMFAAFNEAQLEEGMRKLGINPNPRNRSKITSIGYGMYVRKSDVDALREMLRSHSKEKADAIAADLTGETFIKDMFVAEMENHEYAYTMDLTDTLHALGLTRSQVFETPVLLRGLKLAHDEILCG